MRRVGIFKPKICVVCSVSYAPTTGKQKACVKCSKAYFNMKHAEQMKVRSRKRKLQAITYLGGACLDCNQEFHPAVYEFHHTNPSGKENHPASALQKSWENFKLELDKCVLLCANCHRLRHHNWESGV